MSLYEEKVRAQYDALVRKLIEKKLTITTMESATAGQLASLLTDTEGSSAILKGAFVTYSNEAKLMQGVPAEVLEMYTVYSKETAEAMAVACRKAYDADIGVGVTGTFGNIDPANEAASIPGQVYYSIDYRGKVNSFFAELPPQPNRLMYKLVVAELVGEKLDDILRERELS